MPYAWKDQDRYTNARTLPWTVDYPSKDPKRPWLVNRWSHGLGNTRDSLCDARGRVRRFPTREAAQRACDQANRLCDALAKARQA